LHSKKNKKKGQWPSATGGSRKKTTQGLETCTDEGQVHAVDWGNLNALKGSAVGVPKNEKLAL